ncbi:peptide chain release factor N(5)-glutamine methyltransferase [Clostridium sediminicola]|uniref:peptide chain release factor N(5)-glutamine methyltransferase n=1 Tax=Clostridium sediminicola TaxID=3114879 RepID=UPI0031F20B03
MKISELLIKSNEILKSANIDSYIIDGQLILSKVIKKDRIFIITNREHELDGKTVQEFFRLIEKRKNKMPVKYILNNCEFMGFNFYVKDGVLIPRPDTEILVEKTLEEIVKYNYRTVCDLCCGTGAIGLSLAKMIRDIKVDLYDISDIALQVTTENISRLDLKNKASVYKSDLLKKAKSTNVKFDVIVSNPPYIKDEVINTLMDDVKNFEPHIALNGGKDGLDFYRRITLQAKENLNNNGLLSYEIGHDQKYEVISILKENGFTSIRTFQDLAGKDRVVVGRLKEP